MKYENNASDSERGMGMVVLCLNTIHKQLNQKPSTYLILLNRYLVLLNRYITNSNII
jgi:hypothetical protein